MKWRRALAAVYNSVTAQIVSWLQEENLKQYHALVAWMLVVVVVVLKLAFQKVNSCHDKNKNW